MLSHPFFFFEITECGIFNNMMRIGLQNRKSRIIACVAVLFVLAAGGWGWLAYVNFQNGNISSFYRGLSETNKSCIKSKTSNQFLNRLKTPEELFTQADQPMIQAAMDCVSGKFYK